MQPEEESPLIKKRITNLKKSVVSGWDDGVRQIFIYTEFDDKEGK
jgi:hypothetical protein